MIKVPPYLKKGDTIGLVAPAGYMPEEKFAQCIKTLTKWGFKILRGSTPGHQFHYFSGTDDERREDLQQMLDCKEVKAILCVRGGYGTSRIIDQLDFKKFRRNPKWIIGFSDITALHSHLSAKLKIASIHGPMAAAFNDGEWKNEYVKSLHEALTGRKTNYKIPRHDYSRNGTSQGQLTGGNLSLLVHVIGSQSEVDTKNKILFIEEVGEYIYSVDRMMLQLKRHGQLNKLAGLIVGTFSDSKDTTVPFGRKVEDVVRDAVKEYGYPVAFGFPVGHEKENLALKAGLKFELKVGRKYSTLKEI